MECGNWNKNKQNWTVWLGELERQVWPVGDANDAGGSDDDDADDAINSIVAFQQIIPMRLVHSRVYLTNWNES